ncbi:MAG: protein-disulfide reductase DsbD domain-containing protein [Wolbachia sp.]
MLYLYQYNVILTNNLYIAFIFFCTQLYAEEEVAKFDLLISKVNKANLTFEGAIKVTIKSGWHIYYKDPEDFGLPTSFDCKGNTSNTDIYWPVPKEHEDKVGKQHLLAMYMKIWCYFPLKPI